MPAIPQWRDVRRWSFASQSFVAVGVQMVYVLK
jgi:hypothetical protein